MHIIVARGIYNVRVVAAEGKDVHREMEHLRAWMLQILITFPCRSRRIVHLAAVSMHMPAA